MLLDVPVTRASSFIGDNQSDVLFSSYKNEIISKTPVAIDYHNTRATVYNKVIDPWWIPRRDNPLDMFTKPLCTVDLKRYNRVMFNFHLTEKYITLKQHATKKR